MGAKGRKRLISLLLLGQRRVGPQARSGTIWGPYDLEHRVIYDLNVAILDG